MEIAGYIASIFIGIALGLLGGGGSILTVPVLVYLFSIDAVLATTYSLFIVGLTSVVGSVSYFKKNLVQIKTAMVFGIPSIAAVFFARAYILPAIPPKVFSIGNFDVSKDILLMVLFAVLMIFASYSMIRKGNKGANELAENKKVNYPLLLLQGVIIGLLTGMVGAGGGFLIIPALVKFLNLPIKKAIGTSLVIISMNSLLGFLFSIGRMKIDWQFLFTIAAIAILGILIGSYLSTKIEGKKLKPAFGWFVLTMGIYILIKEILL